jgi:hypothetical protein
MDAEPRMDWRSRIVTVTCDSDFGELAFRFGLPAPCGIVLFRIEWSDPLTDNAFAVTALTSRDDLAGVFAVVERDRIRIRPLPKTPDGDAQLGRTIERLG